MSDQGQPSTKRDATDRSARPTGRGPARRPNRAQVKAMEARTAIGARAESGPMPVRGDTAGAAMAPGAAAPDPVALAPRRSRARTQTRPTARPVPLSRAEEYRFIRSDLRRLLITAGTLGVLMLGLLLVLDV